MKTFMNYRLLIFLILFSGIFSFLSAQNSEKDFDLLIGSQYKPGEPGAAVLVARNGKVIYRNAFGMANMELGVAMKPEMVFEIGSMTKQFTAVSILMLMEQGKLSLDDEITKYIADYPTQGNKITIHHLLTHTSGIKSYTGMMEWRPLWRKDMQPMEMIDLFMNQPMDFAPGEKYLYNNSAYFMLGYIIEKASGLTYPEFLEKNIFKPLQMSNTFYGSQTRIIPGRAAGYQNQDGFTNAEYLSLTQPYSAGSIMSNVDDLLKWQLAISDNRLVKKETIAKAFIDYKLNNGTPIHYGYGWGLNEINGSRTIEHGGGIFGYTTNGIWLPDEDVYVVMLTNRDDKSPGDVSIKIAAMAIGKPYPGNETGFAIKSGSLESLAGVYEFEDGSTRSIIYEAGILYSLRTGSSRFRLIPVAENKFMYENSFSIIEFAQAGGAEREVVFSNRIEKFKGHKTDKAIAVKAEMELEPRVLESYIGEYEIQPGFSLRITLEDNHLMAQATGQEKFEVFAKTPTKFFLKVVDAQIEFVRNDKNVVDSLILYQGGQTIKAMKK